MNGQILRWAFLGILTMVSIAPMPAQPASEVDSAIWQLTDRLTKPNEGRVIRVGETGLLFLQFDHQGPLIEGSQIDLVRLGAPIRAGGIITGYEKTKLGVARITKVIKDKALAQMMGGNPRDVIKLDDKAYVTDEQKGRLVVTPFTYGGNPTEFSIALQEKLITVLVNKGVKVVERSQLEKVLKEQQLSYSGLVDLSSAQQLGKLLGANQIMLGTVTDQGSTVAVNSRLVDVETADITAAAEIELTKTSVIAQGLEKIIHQPGVSQGQSQNSSLFFENEMLRIEVVSFTKESEGFLLKLRYFNKTKGLMNLELSAPGKNTYLVDSQGNQYSFKDAEMAVFGGRDIPRGAPRISSILFRSDNNHGNELTFTAKYQSRTQIIVFRRFAISIAGLRP